MRILLYLAYIALVVYCLVDVIQHPDPEPHRLPRWAWILIILFFPLIGAGAWLMLKFIAAGQQQPRRTETYMAAPDDDPEYLVWLREQERRRRMEGER